MASLTGMEEVVRELEEKRRFTYSAVRTHLQTYYGFGERGTSVRTIRSFCLQHNIMRTAHRIPHDHLEASVTRAISQTGPSYGRKMMTGYLAAGGLRVGQTTVGRIMKDVHPEYQEMRQQGARNLNPVPYVADYPGQKLHLDQNEKISMYGVTHVATIDGFSRYITAAASMPLKNNLTIYDDVYRKTVLSHGMWDVIRVDKGHEFFLTLHVQNTREHLRRDRRSDPFKQTKSTRNHVIERVWPEINQRLNYPIKFAMREMEGAGQFDVGDNLHRFCSSQMLLELCNIGRERIVAAHNEHPIPGRGIPSVLMYEKQTGCVTEADFPSSVVTAEEYRQQVGVLTCI